MDPVLILFAIEAGVRLGRKLSEVLIDETHERPLLLPLGDLHANLAAVNAIEFFDRPENVHRIEAGGPYQGFDREELAKAHATLTVLDERLGGRGETLAEAGELVDRVHRFEQLERSVRSNPPLQRLLGTLVEVGIDWFEVHPEALGRRSAGRKVLTAFVRRLDDVPFAEGRTEQIVGRLLAAALEVFAEDSAWLDDDERLQALLAGVIAAWIAEIEEAGDLAEQLRREDRFERIGRSALRGAASAIAEDAGLFLPGDARMAPLVESALRQVLSGLRDHEDLFTPEAVEEIVDGALRAVAENAELFVDQQILQELIAETSAVLADRELGKVLSRETAAAILAVGLEVTAQNVETLIVPRGERRQLLAATVAALAHGLAGGPGLRALLSRRQLVVLFALVCEEVARDPERLLGEWADTPEHTVLAHTIGAVAAALGEEPRRLVRGEGALELLRAALHAVVRNADKLLDLESADPRSHLLYRIFRELALAVLEAEDPRDLLSREVFLELVQRVLPVASAHAGALLESDEPIVRETLSRTLELASGALEDRINGENLPPLVAALLAGVLRGELPRDEPAPFRARAVSILEAE